jgi:hypothetical protein
MLYERFNRIPMHIFYLKTDIDCLGKELTLGKTPREIQIRALVDRTLQEEVIGVRTTFIRDTTSTIYLEPIVHSN